MPSDGYSTVTISDNLPTKLTRIMTRHDRSSYAEAIKYAADTTLAQEDEITIQELIQLLGERTDKVDGTSYNKIYGSPLNSRLTEQQGQIQAVSIPSGANIRTYCSVTNSSQLRQCGMLSSLRRHFALPLMHKD